MSSQVRCASPIMFTGLTLVDLIPRSTKKSAISSGHPLTGAYYFVPAADSLRRFIPDEETAG